MMTQQELEELERLNGVYRQIEHDIIAYGNVLTPAGRVALDRAAASTRAALKELEEKI